MRNDKDRRLKVIRIILTVLTIPFVNTYTAFNYDMGAVHDCWPNFVSPLFGSKVDLLFACTGTVRAVAIVLNSDLLSVATITAQAGPISGFLSSNENGYAVVNDVASPTIC